MRFVSTRGAAPELGFCEATLSGLASDGGLYVPAVWPTIPAAEIAGFAGKPYTEVAYAVISRFVDGEIPEAALRAIIGDAYARFRHPSVAPLVELEPNLFVLELFHGPTLAFKDVAMQVLARLMDHMLVARGERATIVGATSGDTGSAAIEAFAGRASTDVFILHPRGRTSDVQRRQMTTVTAPNVHNVAVEGSFDDCQALVKAMFGDEGFRQRVGLAAVNSINWARIVAQIVYYFTAAVSLGAPGRKVNFVVPTGNFGDIFAGYAAKRMGLPIGKLTIATNANDILTRTLETGTYAPREVVPTVSPSMDIQISSNFERLLYEALGRDSAALRALLVGRGAFDLPAEALEAIRADFLAGRASEDETLGTIDSVHRTTGYLLDPHTAVGVTVAKRQPADGPTICLATAHPAKFPDAIRRATGTDVALPAWLAGLHDRPERYDVLPNDLAVLQGHVLARSRPTASTQ